VLSYANLSITLTAPDGTTFSWYFEYPGNYTYDGVSKVSAKVSQTYAGYRYDISFSYDASTQLATLSATLTSLTWTSYPFLNQYYLVRPVLVILSPAPAPGPYMPGQALVIAAYGYGPGYPWTTVIPNAPFLYNNITIRLDYTVLNASLPLDKDGNATFAYVYLPAQLTFGVHYLKGTDSWGYEYTEAIIIGVAAYWAKIVLGKYSPDNRVSAGYYNNARIEVCPCPESLGVVGMKYCGNCAVYAGDCDYLGDYIEVVVSGLVPGESVNVSFGGVYRGTVTADSNGMARIVFVVPTLPSGQYVISIVGSITGYTTVEYFYNGTAFLSGVYPVVYPKIVLLDLATELAPLTDNSTTVVPAPVIVGSGIVQVVGTGFTPGVQFLGVLINNTDATASVNSNVARWNANSDGVLVAYSIAGRTITPGLWIPMVEPGKYKVELVFLMPGFTVPNVSMGGYVFVINNISIMATKDDLSKATSQILSSLSALDTKLSAALTELSGRLDTVISQLSSLNNTLTGFTESVATLSSKLDALSSDLKSTRSDVLSAISGVDAKVTALQSAVASARSDILSAVAGVDAKVTALSGKIDTLTTSLANVTAGLSTLMSQLKDLSDKMSTTLATLSTTVAGLSTKIDAVTTALSDLKTAVAGVSSKVDSVSAAVSDLKNSVSAVSSKVDTVSSAVSGVSSKVDDVSKAVGTVSSKLDTMSSDLKKSISDMQTALSGQLSTASIVLYVATILALLAFVFALLAYLSVRKATATK
jgi:archaellum component FlaC